ncbi:MAG: PD-(D/E)XK nuclease family protein [Campylobacterota bacterium]|nr:PD-(D/E)XK nuclease family protein [Campylobacterota bacterium]
MSSTNVKYINETWLSNQLVWLLDSKGSHGLGSEFSKKFFTKVLGDSFVNKKLNLDNFEVCREFYLQVEALDKINNDESARRLDIVYMDLSQETVIVIENKYAGTNSKNQLSEYMDIEKLFRVKNIHYIYLTYIESNFNFKNLNESKKECVIKKYKKSSWQDNILPIIENFALENYDLFKLYSLLKNDPKDEKDFDLLEVLNIMKIIGNKHNDILINKDRGDEWKIEESKYKLSNSSSGQDINIYRNGKSIQINYGKNVINIQMGLSNKQIVYFLIHVIYKFYEEMKNGKKDKSKILSVGEMYQFVKKESDV